MMTRGERGRHRRRLYKAQAGLCALCGFPMIKSPSKPTPAILSLDHIVPLGLGGPDVPENLRATHQGCNSVRDHEDIWAFDLIDVTAQTVGAAPK